MIRTQSSHCRSLGSIPGQGTNVLQAEGYSKKKKKKSFINAKIEAENLISKIIITALRNQGDR